MMAGDWVSIGIFIGSLATALIVCSVLKWQEHQVNKELNKELDKIEFAPIKPLQSGYFIRLTEIETKKTVYIDARTITGLRYEVYTDEVSYTRVTYSGDATAWVEETPEKILEMINGTC